MDEDLREALALLRKVMDTKVEDSVMILNAIGRMTRAEAKLAEKDEHIAALEKEQVRHIEIIETNHEKELTEKEKQCADLRARIGEDGIDHENYTLHALLEKKEKELREVKRELGKANMEIVHWKGLLGIDPTEKEKQCERLREAIEAHRYAHDCHQWITHEADFRLWAALATEGENSGRCAMPNYIITEGLRNELLIAMTQYETHAAETGDMKDVEHADELGRELKSLPEAPDVEELKELHRMQLAGIMTASKQNTEKSRKERIGKDNPYWTVAYQDVCDAVDREISLTDQITEKEKEVGRLEASRDEWKKKATDRNVELIEKEKELREVREAYRHYHVSSHDGSDTCAECGFNLRDPIHIRAALTTDGECEHYWKGDPDKAAVLCTKCGAEYIDKPKTTEGDDVRCMDDTALETVDRMCARSLSPGVHDMWETVKYELARARTTEGEKGECVWKADEDGVYWTSCDNGWCFDVGGPKENGAKYCPYCGKPISTTKPEGEV